MALTGISKVGTKGINADLAPIDLAPEEWSSAKNVRFFDGKCTNFHGHKSYTTPTVQPYWLTYLDDNFVYTGLDKVYKYTVSTDTHADITGTDLTGTATDRFVGGYLNGILAFTNGVDAPRYWSGSGNTADLTDWPASTTCKFIRPFKNFLIAGNITKSGTNYPHMVKWSNIADSGALPNSWDETDAANEAGENDVADTPGQVVDGLSLRDAFVVYKEDAAYGMQFIGGDFQFRFWRLPEIRGMLAPNCAVEAFERHVVLGDGDLYSHDGQVWESIVDGRVRRELFRRIDRDNYQTSYLAHDPTFREIWICYPEDGESTPTEALVWSYAYNTFTFRELPSNARHITTGVIDPTRTWDGSGLTWDASEPWDNGLNVNNAVIAAGDDLFQMDYATQFDGTDPVCFAERTDIPLGGQEQWHTINALYPRMEGNDTVQFYVGSQVHPGDSVAWEGPYDFNPATQRKVDCRVTGPLHAIRIESKLGQRWILTGLDIEYFPSGWR